MSTEHQWIFELAQQVGFQPATLEKVLRLFDLLNDLSDHAMLRDCLALKGGTALNLFQFDVPRLSVDIDLNYIGTADPQAMKQHRPELIAAVQAIFRRQGFTIRRAPKEHAGGKWTLRYPGVRGTGANLEVDINFMYRVPLFPVRRINSKLIGTHQARDVLVLDQNELIAGKLCALLGRTASRDLFDAHQIFQADDFDQARVRLTLLIYGASQRKDWRTVSVEDVQVDLNDVRQRLVPVLATRLMPAVLGEWVDQMLATCRQQLATLFPLHDHERQFLDRLLDHGEIKPELLTDDPDLAERIRQNPGLHWKALNVRKFKSS